MILGTPSYLAPEAVTDPDTMGPAGDLYSLGCVGYYLLTGRRVFEGKTAVDVCVKHVSAEPTPPSTYRPVPAELERVILMCLAKKPEDRPANAGVLAQLLRAVPASNNWSEDQAIAWWGEFQKSERKTIATADTLTITVDLGDRDGVAFPIDKARLESGHGGSVDAHPEAPVGD
jgi:serine/threonine-protein kinase